MRPPLYLCIVALLVRTASSVLSNSDRVIMESPLSSVELIGSLFTLKHMSMLAATPELAAQLNFSTSPGPLAASSPQVTADNRRS